MSIINTSTTDVPPPPSTAVHSTIESYYTLHPSDNPGALITPVLLHGDNYSEWAIELYNSLQAKQKIGFIDGSIIKPSTNPDLARWTSTNSMIVGWIRTSIDHQVRSTVSHVPDAHQLWESLKRRFSVKNGVRRHLLEGEITTCKQNGQSVLEYYGRLSKLWEELHGLKTSPSCTCAATAEIEKEREDAKVHKFLFGLDEPHFSIVLSRATKLGTLPLTKDYFLVNVLYVPDFTCTLISFSKLLKQTGCIAIFTDTLCVLQDRFTRTTLIGGGEER